MAVRSCWILAGTGTRCLNYSWHRFNKVLETFLRDFCPYWHACRFVSCTSMMWISCSTTSQRCSIGLRPGDCGGHLSKVNSLSCSRNQSEMIWALWHGALSCWKQPSEDGYTVVIKGWTWSATNTRLWHIKDSQLVLRGPKCAKNISPRPLHPHHQPEPLRQGRMDPCFHVFYAKFWPQHLNVAAEIETQKSDQATFLQSSIIQFWWACVNCSLRFLADRRDTRCGLLLL